MSIEIVICCDNCNRQVRGFASYMEARAHVKPLGWTTSSSEQGGRDFCPDCARERKAVVR